MVEPQVVSGDAFAEVRDDDLVAIQSSILKWAFGTDAICIAAPIFIQNKVAQLLATLAAVRASSRFQIQSVLCQTHQRASPARVVHITHNLSFTCRSTTSRLRVQCGHSTPPGGRRNIA
jgi:hypothetical protein